MIGIPAVIATKQDWLNVYQYVLANNNTEQKRSFRNRLIALNEARYMKKLKDGAPSDPEQQTQEHFEDVPDPASPFTQSGLTESEIEGMIGGLNAA